MRNKTYLCLNQLGLGPAPAPARVGLGPELGAGVLLVLVQDCWKLSSSLKISSKRHSASHHKESVLTCL